jgi:hypothetical protein
MSTVLHSSSTTLNLSHHSTLLVEIRMEDLKARKKKREKINNLVAERLVSNPELDEKTARIQINREAVLRIRIRSN